MKKIYCMLLLLGLSSCAMPPPPPPPSPLQVQAMQTREFVTSKQAAFNAAVSVFQNLGYIIQSASLDTGFVNAQSPTQTNTENSFNGFDFNFGNGQFSNGPAGGNTNVIVNTVATAFVQQLGNKTQIRLNFVKVKKTSSYKGQQGEVDSQILDPQIYQNAFSQIEQQIFVSSSLHPTKIKNHK